MNSNPNYLFIIPARGGSKGVPKKNLKELRGKPLVAWSIEQALSVADPNNVLLSTDSPEIASVAENFGLKVPFLRPSELSQDETSTEPVLLHALDWYCAHRGVVDAVVLLQPTSPFRKINSLRGAMAQFEAKNADSLLSVTENHHFFWRDRKSPEALYDYRRRPRRQDISDDQRWYRENGSIYITKVAVLRKDKNRLGGLISMYLMSEEESWEIDTPEDFGVVSSLMAKSE